MRRGPRSRPITPAKVEAETGVIGWDQEAGTRRLRPGGWDEHVLCQDDAAKVTHEGKREDRPPHAHSIDGIYAVTNACMNAHTCINMHVELSW
eukprot:349641-Chlamydomonas_euryale.AAC.23